MMYATVRLDGSVVVARVDRDAGLAWPLALDPGEAALGVAALARRAAEGQAAPAERDAVPLASLALLAPVPRPARNIFCVGKNYHEHAEEFARSGFDSSAAAGAVPKAPIIFSKVPESVIGPGETIRINASVSMAVDYEAELAVIIGRGGRGISRDRALDHVWGYTIVNDVTARDLQGRHSQWLIGKSQDTFCPMGPFAVTADSLDLADTAITCEVNGEPRQASNTKLLIFDVPTLIATLSAGITLMPGDVIATGTPAGVGIGFDPPRYLKPGDVVRVTVGGIGTLENPVGAA
ncbi:fumarylacetoacetate hydrolase family protein [Elioraea rosea]|uniref:fumarylacetoacetate hydrolase family protein n=1 Tax=Elioraea rosea TaxID=2492390 RepID=UPI00118473D5|nr:fumarylacetoacetate hydrolase family protein [Elioraea rosea]